MIHARRCVRHALEKGPHGKIPFMNKLRYPKGKGSLKTDNAARGFRELSLLLLRCRVGSVISRDNIDRPVSQTFDDGHAVRLLAERRIHLRVGAISNRSLLGQRKVMRCCLRVNIAEGSFRLSLSNEFYRLFGADVLYLNAGPGLKGESKVSLHHDDLRHPVGASDMIVLTCLSVVNSVIFNIIRILLVEADRNSQISRANHGLLHDLRVPQRNAVIGEAHSPRAHEFLHVREYFTHHAAGHICT